MLCSLRQNEFQNWFLAQGSQFPWSRVGAIVTWLDHETKQMYISSKLRPMRAGGTDITSTTESWMLITLIIVKNCYQFCPLNIEVLCKKSYIISTSHPSLTIILPQSILPCPARQAPATTKFSPTAQVTCAQWPAFESDQATYKQ